MDARLKHDVQASAPNIGRERLGLVFGLTAALIWGGYLAVTRRGIEAGLSAADLAFLRYTTAGLLLLPWLVGHRPFQLAGTGWSKGCALALLAGPPFVLVGASGFLFAPLAHSAVIQLGSLTLVSIVLSLLLTGERAGRQRLLGVAIIVAGLAVTAGPGLLQGGSTAWKGDVLFALAGSMWALFTALQHRWRIAPLAATVVVSVLSAAVYGPLYLMSAGLSQFATVSPSTVIEQIIVQGVLSGVVALFVFSRSVAYLGPGRASLFPAMAPAVAILSGIPLTGEIPAALQLAGLVILSAGLVIAVRGKASPGKSG